MSRDKTKFTSVAIYIPDKAKLNKISAYYSKKIGVTQNLAQTTSLLIADKIKEIENENRENTPTP